MQQFVFLTLLIRGFRYFQVQTLTWRHMSTLVFASSAMAVFVFCVGHVNCWSDSHEFMEYAKDFFTPANRLAWYYRDPAYPFLIWLSGYPLTNNLFVLFLFQTLMAAAVPPLICLTLSTFSPMAALAAGWVSLISLVPFIFQLQLFNDQLHLFLLVLCACTAVRCLSTGHIGCLYGVAVSFALLLASRPTFVALAPLPLVLATRWLLEMRQSNRARVYHVVGAVAIFALLTVANLWLRAAPYVGGYPPGEIGPKRAADAHLAGAALHHDTGFTPVTNYSAEQLFSQLYLHGGKFAESFRPEDGPATKRFLEVMQIYIQNSDYVNGTNESFIQYTERFLHAKSPTVISPAQALDTYLHHPIYQVATLHNFFDWYGNRANALVRGMYVEQITRHPKILVSMLRNGFMEVMFASYSRYHYNDEYFSYPFLPTVYFEPFDQEWGCKYSNVSDFLGWKPHSIGRLHHFNHHYVQYYLGFSRVCNVIGLAGLPLYLYWLFSRSASQRLESLAYLTLFALYWVPNVIMMTLVLIIYRYQASAILLQLMMAMMTLRQLVVFTLGPPPLVTASPADAAQPD